jgi:hypothetical protein
MVRRWVAAVLVPFFCAGCEVGRPYARPVVQTPSTLKEAAGNDDWKMAAPADDLVPRPYERTDGASRRACAL